MIFSSFGFLVFLPVVYLLYWGIAGNKRSYQNNLLLAASYFFYACWDYRFLFLLIFSTLLDYYTGKKMDETVTVNKRKFWFWLSVVVNVGFLAVFKYYNFFAGSFVALLASFGYKAELATLEIILPVGISFYTFHGLSYVIDIYNRKIRPENNFFQYALFVSFFPLLVAGPIERATHLLPQIRQQRSFDYEKTVDGLRQIIWGFFKKVVIADNCATVVNLIFNHSSAYSGSTLVVGAVLFSFQIYCDFSGYSDIALGTARLFGIDLLRNFAFPYFSRDIAEFWRRWHISLTSWFRDYLYIPLGGSKGSTAGKIRNTCIIFLVSGLWHGANWTFIAWGALNAIYFLPLLLLNKNRNHLAIAAENNILPPAREAVQILFTFALTTFAWIFFRAASLPEAFAFVKGIFSASLFTKPQVMPVFVIILLVFFLVIEWMGRKDQYAIQRFTLSWPRYMRWSFYYVMIFMVHKYFDLGQNFIYFQF